MLDMLTGLAAAAAGAPMVAGLATFLSGVAILVLGVVWVVNRVRKRL